MALTADDLKIHTLFYPPITVSKVWDKPALGEDDRACPAASPRVEAPARDFGGIRCRATVADLGFVGRLRITGLTGLVTSAWMPANWQAIHSHR